MSVVLVILAAAAYLGAAASLGFSLARAERGRRLGQALAWLGVLCHVATLALSLPLAESSGIDLNIFHALSLVGALMACWLLLLSLFRPIISVGAALLPVVAVVAVAPLLHSPAVPLEGVSIGLEAHIALALLGYSVLGIAAVIAMGLAVQERHLRQHRQTILLNHLPPLQSSERMLFQAILTGWLLLSATLLTGWVFMEDMFAQSLAHKTVLSILSWLVFAALLFGRWQRGWRGRTAIRFTLAGMALLVLAYFGSKLVIELILQRPA